MLVKPVNIVDRSVFNAYSEEYNIFRDLYDPSGIALELFDLAETQVGFMKRFLIDRKLMFYVKEIDATIKLLILGVSSEFQDVSSQLISNGYEELGNKISKVLNNYCDYDRIKYSLNGKEFGDATVLIQGILNCTPDSFSDGGKFITPEAAFERAERMISEGVDIIDVGGESTRPGSSPVNESEEMNRVLPVIEMIKAKYPEILISIDTYKSAVAAEALKRGAVIVNDISGGTFDDNIFNVTADNNAAFIVMHIKGKPKDMQVNPSYRNLMGEVYGFLNKQITKARRAGIETVIADPGIGFGKKLKDNYEIINRLPEFKGLGTPILLGISRKSFLGKALDLSIEEREIPSVISETVAVVNGARIIRTHNVKNGVYLKKLFNFYKNSHILTS